MGLFRNRHEEIEFRAADLEAATREANNPNLSPDARRLAQYTADEHRNILRDFKDRRS